MQTCPEAYEPLVGVESENMLHGIMRENLDTRLLFEVVVCKTPQQGSFNPFVPGGGQICPSISIGFKVG